MLNVERLGVVLNPKDKYHAKFNAGMVREGNRVHMLYRWAEAESSKCPPDGISPISYVHDFIAYAELDTNGKLIKDYDKPLIAPFNEWSKAGCQDPRIIIFEGMFYIFFTSWDLSCARVGVARTKDFKNIERLGIIPTIQFDKDAFILPERIRGKIVYIHRINSEIQIDYFDSFDEMFDRRFWANYSKRMHEKVVIRSEFPWENKKVGGSVPPIRTESGWLFIYHGVADDRVPFCYRTGAALLDLKNPSKVIARLPYPLLEPQTDYEIYGHVNNVVFPQGAFINNGWIYISYGGADRVVAMARVKYDELLSELEKNVV